MRRIRPQRIAEQIKKELGVLLQQEVKDPRIGFVTVTGVEVTPDYEEAKVYVSIMGDEEEREQALEGLKRAQGFLRTELGRRIEVRHIPELIFKLDTSLDYGLRIDRLLSELKGASEEAGGHEGDRFSGVEDGDPSAGEGLGAVGRRMIDSLAAAYRTLYGWLIADRDDVLVVSHVRPDGDALGAQTAMHRIIQKLGRRSAMVNADHPPKRFDYLPGYAEIHTVEALMSRGPYRRAVFVDCADRARIGDVEALLSSDARIANIDHHATNDRYGEINVVRAEASSTCEIVYDFVRAVGVAMDEALATALYTGLLTDTGGFRYQNTSPKVLHDAAELVECGAEPYSIAEQALETMSLPQLRLLARVLGDIQLYAGGRVALIEVTAEALREAGAELDDTEGLVHYARNIEGVEVAVLLREQDEGIKASFRSRRRVDVAALAQKFGGGGHVRAAGATLAPPMAEARARVLEVLRATLSNPEEGKR